MATSYGQVGGRRRDGEQRALAPEDAERAHAERWLRENPGERECWAVDGKPRSATWAAAALGYDRPAEMRRDYATGPLWHRGRMVRRYGRR